MKPRGWRARLRAVMRHLWTVDLGGRDRASLPWWQRPTPILAWVAYQCMAHLTPRGVACGTIGLLPTLSLLIIGIDNAVSRFGFALLAVMLADGVVGYVNRPQVHVRFQSPPRMAGGAQAFVRYTLRNLGRRPLRAVSVDSLRGPDRRVMRLAPPSLTRPIPPGGEETLEGHLTIQRRGRYRLPPLRVDATGPFGFWRWGVTQWTPTRIVNVYPAYTPLRSMTLPLGVRQRQDTAPARRLARSALEFHACREFREGDSLRHLHPRSSARLGMPVVKEFQAEGEGRTAIMTDTWHTSRLARLGFGQDRAVEAALALTAAVVDALARTDRVLELLVAGPGVFRFESAGRQGLLAAVLDILAEVEPCQQDPLALLAPELLQEIRSIQSICLILTHWDRARAQWVNELAAAGVGLKVIAVLAPHTRIAAPLPTGLVRVSPAEILQGRSLAL